MLKYQLNAYQIYEHKFDNWMSEVHNKWIYDDFINDEEYRKYWISITSLSYNANNNDIYMGIGSFSNELLWRFDRDSKKIESMGYEKIADKYDAKFHRSLEIDGDTLYAAVAMFHDIDKQFEAKGGRLIKYGITSKKFEILAVPHDSIYIQSIALDKKNKVIYGFGASPEIFWKYDIDSGESKLLGYIGSGAEFAQAHNPVIDDSGKVWGTYGILRAFDFQTGWDSIRMFCYDPYKDTIEFFKYGLPKVSYNDKARPDTAINGGDGYIYFGTEEGALTRLNPSNGEVKLLCKPINSRRLAGLVRSKKDGLLYGIGGENYEVSIFAYNTEKEKLIDVVPFYSSTNGERPVRIHHAVITNDNVIYAGENDNIDRPGYLWECILL